VQGSHWSIAFAEDIQLYRFFIGFYSPAVDSEQGHHGISLHACVLSDTVTLVFQ